MQSQMLYACGPALFRVQRGTPKQRKVVMSYWVYVHTCKANGKRYVGVTTKVKPEFRWVEGRGYWYNKYFYSDILKHGWDNFEHEVFEVDSKEEMYRKEVELISFYHSNDPEYGYNHSVGGECGALGYRHSEEARRKISEATKKSNLDPEIRRKRSESLKKSHLDPEYRRKQSEAVKKSLSNPEVRRKMSLAKKGKSFSEEHREHLAESNRRRAKDPEIRRKQSEALKGRPKPKVKIKLPDGTILEMCKSLLTRWYINKGKKFEYVD